MYKAAVFDVDGTIADTIDTICYYGNRSMKKFGLPEIERERYKYLVGRGYENLVKGMLCEKNAYSDALFNEMKEFYHDDYETDSMYLTKLYDGISDVVKFLKNSGFKLGVLSNKPTGAVHDVIGAFFKEGTFDILCGGGDGFPLKPDPSALLDMLKKLEVSPDECIYAGDTKVDVETGKNAKIFTIGALWGFRTREELENAGADVIASEPREIIEIVKNKNNF